jgi:hypothetical protein
VRELNEREADIRADEDYEAWLSERWDRDASLMEEYRDMAESFHEMQVTNGWCDCFKGGTDGTCDLAKKLEGMRKDAGDSGQEGSRPSA